MELGIVIGILGPFFPLISSFWSNPFILPYPIRERIKILFY